MKKYIFIISSLIFFAACDEESIDRTVFVPDENDSRLPAYTEWGYNSFGAIYERTYFVATNNRVPCKIIYKDGSLKFVLIGSVGGSYYPSDQMSLHISFPFQSMQQYQDLLALHDVKLNLKDCNVELGFAENPLQPLSVLSGELHFKRAQLLTIDDVEDRVILSGTFFLQFLTENLLPETISDGRFDIGIYKDFYSFEQQ